MAVPTINVVGKVVRPDGVGLAGGDLLVKLIHPGHADDGGTEVVVGAGPRKYVIEVDGSVDFDLIPTDIITSHDGGSSVYKVTFRQTDGNFWVQFWVLLASGDNPIDIGDITVVQTIDGVPIPELDKLPDVDASGANNGDVLIYNSATGMWEAGPQSGGSGSTNLTSLTDVLLVSLADGDYLVYDSGAAKWKNLKLRAPVFTTATEPAANIANRGLEYRLKDPGEPEYRKVILQTSAGGYSRVVVASAE